MTQLHRKHAKIIRTRVYKQLIETRGWKFRSFLRYLRIFKFVSFSPRRGEFLESYYTVMRYLDDIVDGDVPVPAGYSDGAGYLSEKILFSENPQNPVDEADFLLLYCFELAKRFGEDFKSETRDILGSLLFDAKRRGKLIMFPEKELIHHFHLLDVRGTVKATLKIFRDDPEKYHLLEPLGIATRYQFDLEDFESDIKAGYVNISLEECRLFGIGPDDLGNKESSGVRRWFRYRAGKGLDLLKEHHLRLSGARFSLLARISFILVYEYPARKLFRKVLNETAPSV